MAALRRRCSASMISRGLLLTGCVMLLFLAIFGLIAIRGTTFISILNWTIGPTVIQLPNERKPARRCTDEERRQQRADWLNGDASTEKGKRVGLLFFGLLRSLPYTLPHIEKNVIQVLRDAGYRPTVFLHTYNDKDRGPVDGKVATEYTSVDDWEALMPFKHAVTNQTAVLEKYKEELDACINWDWRDNPALTEAPKDYWEGGWKRPNSENWLCQLQSFDEVGRLWEQHYNENPDDYAAVAFLRPDVLFLDPFPVSLLPGVKPNQVWVPGWSGNGGVNDRFALLHPHSAATWKNRLPYTLTHCLEAPIHSESFTKDFAQHEELAVKYIWKPRFVFFRVRGSGEIAPREWSNKLPDVDLAQAAIDKRVEELPDLKCW